jgi:hypothetical protein
VVGPDGKPLAGARGYGLNGSSPPWDREPRTTADFTVPGFNPKHPRPLLLVHAEKGLAGVGQPPKNPGGSVTVQLQPGSTVTGRLVDADGKPRAGIDLEVWFRPAARREWDGYRPERITTDRDGRFRVGPLLPGYEFWLAEGPGEVWVGIAPDSGQTRDLGDVRTKRKGD